MKKLDAFVGPGKIKGSEMVLDKPRKDQEQGAGAGLESWTSFASVKLFPNGGAADIDFVTVPHQQQLGQQLQSTVGAVPNRPPRLHGH